MTQYYQKHQNKLYIIKIKHSIFFHNCPLYYFIIYILSGSFNSFTFTTISFLLIPFLINILRFLFNAGTLLTFEATTLNLNLLIDSFFVFFMNHLYVIYHCSYASSTLHPFNSIEYKILHQQQTFHNHISSPPRLSLFFV